MHDEAAVEAELAARARLGPDGLEHWPPVLVRDLAAATGLDLRTLVPAMGMLPPNEAGVSATFAWDMHHENPVSDPDDLGRRALISWSAGLVSFARPTRPPPPPLGDRLERVTTPEELAALAPVSAIELAAALGVPEAFARTVDVHMSSWRLTTTDGPPTFRGWTVLASLDGTPTGGDLDVFIPASRAAALGPQDVVSDLRVE